MLKVGRSAALGPGAKDQTFISLLSGNEFYSIAPVEWDHKDDDTQTRHLNLVFKDVKPYLD